MEEDYGQAEAIRENLIPNAVGFYTGEAVDDEMMYGDDDEVRANLSENFTSFFSFSFLMLFV